LGKKWIDHAEVVATYKPVGVAKADPTPIKFKTSLGKMTVSKEAAEKLFPIIVDTNAPPNMMWSGPIDPTSFEPIADFNSLTKSWQCGCKVGKQPSGKVIKDCHQTGNHCYRRRQGG
jgi:hypothetical protein